MGSYEIVWKNSAEKDLRSISRQQIPRIIRAIELLYSNPFPPRSHKLKGSDRDYRIRIGNYRILYRVDTKTKIIVIYHIRHRRETYQK